MVDPGLYNTFLFINMGVFPSKSDKSPLKPGTPPINKQGFINPGSTLHQKFGDFRPISSIRGEQGNPHRGNLHNPST